MSLYFVAIEPSQNVIEKAKAIQKDFADRFQSEKSYRNFPHITLIPPFHWNESKENSIVEKFQNQSIETKKFTLIFDGFGSFPKDTNPVIFIQPQPSESLQNLFSEVQKKRKSFHPHLTVAYRDLSFENYQKAWSEYENKPFSEQFEISEIGLYKHFNGKWNLLSSKKLTD